MQERIVVMTTKSDKSAARGASSKPSKEDRECSRNLGLAAKLVRAFEEAGWSRADMNALPEKPETVRKFLRVLLASVAPASVMRNVRLIGPQPIVVRKQYIGEMCQPPADYCEPQLLNQMMHFPPELLEPWRGKDVIFAGTEHEDSQGGIWLNCLDCRAWPPKFNTVYKFWTAGPEHCVAVYKDD